MNRSELKELEHGEKILFTGWPAALKPGKVYRVKKTDFGMMIIDDNKCGRFLGAGDLHERFKKQEPPK